MQPPGEADVWLARKRLPRAPINRDAAESLATGQRLPFAGHAAVTAGQRLPLAADATVKARKRRKYIAEHIADDDNEGDVLAIAEDDGGGAIGVAAAAQVDYTAARPGSAKQVTPPSRKAPVLEKRPKSAFAKSAERAAPVLDLETKVSDFDEEELVLSDDEAETRNRAALERARSSRSKPRIRKTAFPWEAPDEKPSPSAWEAEEKPSPAPSWDDQPSADVVMSPGPPVYDDRSLREYYDEADGDDEPLSETSSVDETELAAALNTPAPAVATSPLKNSPSSPKLQKSPSRWDGMRAAPLPRAAPVAPPQRMRPNCRHRGMRRSWRSRRALELRGDVWCL